MQIVATRASLRRIRHTLMPLLPDLPVKAAHLTEALAAGLGFKTNAALLAWVDGHPHDRIALLEVDPDEFAERLQALHPAYERTGLIIGMTLTISLATAIISCFAAADAPDFAATKTTWAAGASYAARHGASMFSRAAGLLSSRATGPRSKIADMAILGMPDVHYLLAACFARHADADPEMSDFLVDWLLDIAEASAGKGRYGLNMKGVSAIRWGFLVYHAFLPRIEVFNDAVCRRWADQTLPSDLAGLQPQKRPIARRVQGGAARYPQIKIDLSARQSVDIASAHDTGRQTLDSMSVMGLAAYAMWKAGVPKKELAEFAVSDGTLSEYMSDPADWITIIDSSANRTTP